MNCKQGDLAVIVSAEPPHVWAIGQIVQIEKWIGFMPGTRGDPQIDVWETSPFYNAKGDRYGYVRDAQVRPIRDPGDDARDQTLDWLPVPTKEHA